MRFKEILLEEQNKKDETVEEEFRWYRVQHGLLHDVFLRAGKKGADLSLIHICRCRRAI